MGTITVKVTERIERDVEMQLPYYSIGICHIYKVIDKDTCVCVTFGIGTSGIAKSYVDQAFGSGRTQCTEEEFNEKYFEVKNELSKLVGV